MQRCTSKTYCLLIDDIELRWYRIENQFSWIKIQLNWKCLLLKASMDRHVTAQRPSHSSHVNPSLHSSRFYKLKLGTVPLSQGQAFEIRHVADFWRLLQCVLSCVLRADRKTDTASVWLSLLCLYLHFHSTLALCLLLCRSLPLPPSVWCHCLSGD